MMQTKQILLPTWDIFTKLKFVDKFLKIFSRIRHFNTDLYQIFQLPDPEIKKNMNFITIGDIIWTHKTSNLGYDRKINFHQIFFSHTFLYKK